MELGYESIQIALMPLKRIKLKLGLGYKWIYIMILD